MTQSSLQSQQPPVRQTLPQGPSDLKAGTVRINLRGETPLETLIEYVSQRVNIRFIYDDALKSKKINLLVPDEIPVDSLFNLLQSALEYNGFVLTQTENPTWYRVVPQASMPQVSLPAPTITEIERLGPRHSSHTSIFAQTRRSQPNYGSH